jgi:CRP/FNR family cyclic AMP-dependent transcriptional regulator
MRFQLSVSATQFLRAVPMFESLSADELAEMARLAQGRELAPGDLLFSQGGPGDGMFILDRGEVCVSTVGPDGGSVTLAYLGNGAVIGEMSLLDGSPRSASVEAVAPTSGYWVSRAEFGALRRQGSPAACKVLLQLARMLEQRRRAGVQRIRNILSDPARRPAALDDTLERLIVPVRWT